MNWRIFLTPEFLIGTLVAGLLLNVAGAYTVRSIDWVRKALPASVRRAREAESARIEELATAAVSDHALYAALAAEATRLRVHQILQFFIAFCLLSGFALLLGLLGWQQSSGSQVPQAPGRDIPVLLFLLAGGFVLYTRGLDSSRRAARLDTALRAIHKNLKLRIMD